MGYAGAACIPHPNTLFYSIVDPEAAGSVTKVHRLKHP
jgi:hypothetical protein